MLLEPFGEFTKYLECYFRIIEKHGVSVKPECVLTEGHHSFPRFIFGDNDEDIVFVSYRIHYLLHYLLYKHCCISRPDLEYKALFPLMSMRGGKDGCHSTRRAGNSKLYSIARSAFVAYMQGPNNPMRNPETVKKMAASQSLASKGVLKTAEHAANISKGLTGLKKSDEHVDKVNRNPEKIRKTAEKHRGMKRSDETKAAISASKIGKPAPNSGSITFYDPTTFERFKFPKDASDIPEHLVRGMGPGTTPKEPKVKRQVFYNTETMEVLRIPIGDEVPPGFIRGNPALMGERGPRTAR